VFVELALHGVSSETQVEDAGVSVQHTTASITLVLLADVLHQSEVECLLMDVLLDRLSTKLWVIMVDIAMILTTMGILLNQVFHLCVEQTITGHVV
jgi:hypothetical protein